MIKDKIPNELLKNINTCVRITKKEIAKQIAEDIREEYHTVIWKFYHHYTPNMYKRSYESQLSTNYHQLGKDYRKITKWQEDGFIIKFIVGGEFVSGNYEDDNEWVFNRTFNQGIHGWTPISFQGIMSGTQNVEKMGWRGRVKQPRKPLKPSPKERMDEWFERYKTYGNLDKICKPILKNNIKKYLHNR